MRQNSLLIQARPSASFIEPKAALSWHFLLSLCLGLVLLFGSSASAQSATDARIDIFSPGDQTIIDPMFPIISVSGRVALGSATDGDIAWVTVENITTGRQFGPVQTGLLGEFIVRDIALAVGFNDLIVTADDTPPSPLPPEAGTLPSQGTNYPVQSTMTVQLHTQTIPELLGEVTTELRTVLLTADPTDKVAIADAITDCEGALLAAGDDCLAATSGLVLSALQGVEGISGTEIASQTLFVIDGCLGGSGRVIYFEKFGGAISTTAEYVLSEAELSLTGSTLSERAVHIDNIVHALCADIDSAPQVVVARSTPNRLELYDTYFGEMLSSVALTSTGTEVEVMPAGSGRVLAVNHSAGMLELADFGSPSLAYTGTFAPSSHVAVSPDGSEVALIAPPYTALERRSLPSGATLPGVDLAPLGGRAVDLAYDSASNQLAVVLGPDQVAFLQLGTLSVSTQTVPTADLQAGITWDATDSAVYVVGQEGTPFLVDASSVTAGTLSLSNTAALGVQSNPNTLLILQSPTTPQLIVADWTANDRVRTIPLSGFTSMPDAKHLQELGLRQVAIADMTGGQVVIVDTERGQPTTVLPFSPADVLGACSLP